MRCVRRVVLTERSRFFGRNHISRKLVSFGAASEKAPVSESRISQTEYGGTPSSSTEATPSMEAVAAPSQSKQPSFVSSARRSTTASRFCFS
jgi:hypothetical protein